MDRAESCRLAIHVQQLQSDAQRRERGRGAVEYELDGGEVT